MLIAIAAHTISVPTLCKARMHGVILLHAALRLPRRLIARAVYQRVSPSEADCLMLLSPLGLMW